MFDFLSQKFSSLFFDGNSSAKINSKTIMQTLAHVEQALLEADVPYKVTQSFIVAVKADIEAHATAKTIESSEQLLSIIEEQIVAFLGGKDVPFSLSSPATLMVIGLQGAGKTTTLGKLAYKIKKDSEKNKTACRIMMASVDFYRPAAIDQLEILAKKVAVDFYRSSQKDPLAAAKDIMEHYRYNQYDYLLLDTAGRLHIDNTMLQELQDIDHVVQARHKFLVLDAMTGQESLAVAKVFDDIVHFHGSILTKMDSDTRGGSAFAFRYVLKKPIVFVGEGEGIADLNTFFPDRAAEKMLGMGDIQSLLEKAEEKISLNQQQKAESALRSGTFTLQDFSDQMEMMNKIGSLSQLLKYMPGAGSVSPEMLQQGERELDKFKAIISSMTQKERLDQNLLTPSRVKRIANGAGVQEEDVAMLLKRFEEAKQYVKLLNNFKPF